MSFWRQGLKQTEKINNSRINFIIAIIFLLVGLIIFKLFSLQVMNYDLYRDLAAGQHEIYSLLQPQRGRIFLQNEEQGKTSSLYPVATNKNFALLYAVPKDVKEPEKIADLFYELFKRVKIEKEVDELLIKDEADALKAKLAPWAEKNDEAAKAKVIELMAEHERLLNDKQYQEMKKVRREAEINLRKASALEAYLTKLKKPNDVYEPLEQKVDEEILKTIYLTLNNLTADVKSTDLEISGDGIYLLNHGKKKQLLISGLGFTEQSYRYYPENNIGANLIGFVGYVGDQQKGRYGLEEYFDQELAGRAGSIKIERDAKGQAIIINDREYQKADDGGDIILTINRSIQFMACQKLNEAVKKHGADGGSIIIMEPKTGAILAMCSNPDFDGNNYKDVKNIEDFTNPAIFSQYEPGSIFKVITMAMALDQEKVTPQTTYEDTGQVVIADYKIENSDKKANGVQTMTQVLEKSLNTGVIFAMRQIGPDLFADYVKKFGFGEKTGIELAGESKGDMKNLAKKPIRELYAATVSYGQGIAVTPLQMVNAFSTIANNGVMMKPYLVKEIVKADGTKLTTSPQTLGRVISEKAATTLGGMMVNVVENGHGKKAGVKGYWVGGKTGTAQVARKDGRGYDANIHIGSFAGFAPISDPKFAMLIRLDRPRDVEWAESSAAPLFGEMAEYLLNYYKVPKERQ